MLMRGATHLKFLRNAFKPKICCIHSLVQNDRGLLRVSGKDSTDFLQGLITNDMGHLTEGALSMYAMFLNPQGRVMHDVIMYQVKEREYFIETNVNSTDRLARHLMMYKLRKKISIENVSKDYSFISLFNNDETLDYSDPKKFDCTYSNQRPEIKSELNLSKSLDGLIVARDPRCQLLGFKLIAPINTNIQDYVKDLSPSDKSSYTELRYKLGISEGPAELPTGDISPLEANADYMHGVSFHKGCYIGQELTARVHHTGVVRKRYMPVVFSSSVSSLSFDSHIKNSKGKVVGRMRAHAGKYGIALLRIENCLADPDGLSVDGFKMTTFKPLWWPIEASKLE